MTLKDFLLRSLTWWNGQTWGTWLYTRRKGQLVGQDELGNTYYRAIGPTNDPSAGPERRWVIFSGEAEASNVPPGWRGWLQHTTDTAPSEQTYRPHPWEKPHLPNMTGSRFAYRPQGATAASGSRPPATGDYVAWSPDGASADGPSPDFHPGTHGADFRQPRRG